MTTPEPAVSDPADLMRTVNRVLAESSAHMSEAADLLRETGNTRAAELAEQVAQGTSNARTVECR